MPIQVNISDEQVNDVYDRLCKTFPHYPTDHKWRSKEFYKLKNFNRSGMFKPEMKMVGQSGHGLSLAWSYMPHFWNIKCGYMKTPISVWESEEKLKKGIRKMLDGSFWSIKEYHKITSSDHAKYLIENWENEKYCFWQVIPKEMVNKFDQPVLVDEIKSA